MDVLLIILGALCLLLGIIGCVAPVLPGVPLAYVGLLLLQPTEKVQFSWQFLVIWAVVVVVVQLLDYFIPAWGTKRMGGSKWGVWGSTIGLIVGLFAGPWGIVLGPFLGAVAGEWLYIRTHKEQLRNKNGEEKGKDGEEKGKDGEEKGQNTKPTPTPLYQALRAGIGSFLGLLTGTVIKLICCGLMTYYFVTALIG